MDRIIERMLKTHPEAPLGPEKALTECIEACVACAQSCAACADACVGEHAGELAGCVRSNQDCADICDATARVLSRQTSPNLKVIAIQLEACAIAARACAACCAVHADRLMHCRICAAACERAADACGSLLPTIVVASA